MFRQIKKERIPCSYCSRRTKKNPLSVLQGILLAARNMRGVIAIFCQMHKKRIKPAKYAVFWLCIIVLKTLLLKKICLKKKEMYNYAYFYTSHSACCSPVRRPCANLMRMLYGLQPTAMNSGTGFSSLSVGKRHCSIRLRTPQGFPAAAGVGRAGL